MVRRRSRALDYAVYLLVRLLMAFVRILPWRAALFLARGLGRLTYLIDRRHRLVAAANIRHAFPHLDDPGVDRLVRAAFEHIFIVGLDTVRLPDTLKTDNHDNHIDWAPEGSRELCLDWVASGRPIITVTGHVGNWELVCYATAQVGVKAGIIARRLDNPYLDRLLRAMRECTGQKILDKNEDYDKLISYLDNGKIIAALGDQDAGPRGLFVDFLGRPASTFKSIALLSLEYKAIVVVLAAARVGTPMRYRFYLEDIILPEDYFDRPDAVRAITQRYTAALERFVRRHPEQYLWLHRRWKHQPKPRRAPAPLTPPSPAVRKGSVEAAVKQ